MSPFDAEIRALYKRRAELITAKHVGTITAEQREQLEQIERTIDDLEMAEWELGRARARG